jgi:hypothetical protein
MMQVKPANARARSSTGRARPLPAAGVLRAAGRGLVLALAAAAAQAQSGTVWRCVDGSGHAQYTNVKTDTEGGNCTPVVREVSVVQPQAPARAERAAGTPGYPKVDAGTQKSRDDSRRKILEDELVGEQSELAKAKQALAEQEAVRNGNERNYQRVLDRLQPYQDAVAQHERNIDALQKELAAMK